MITPDKVRLYGTCRPKQLVSVAAALIRSSRTTTPTARLMGSNMQRQGRAFGARRGAVCRPPAWKAWLPANFGCGDRRAPPQPGRDRPDRRHPYRYPRHRKISIPPSRGVDIYPPDEVPALQTSRPASNQRPLVKVGDLVRRGDIIADGPSTDLGELAPRPQRAGRVHGRGNGYNFEDSILLSERICEGRTSSPRSISRNSR